MDWTCDERKARQHLLYSSSLDARGEAETRVTQEHLASNCRRGVQDPPSHLGDHSEAGSEQTGVGYLCCCLSCQQAWVSEWVMRTGHPADPSVCVWGGGISIIWHHTLLIRSHDHHNLTYHFELIATGTNLGRLEVSFWNKELWNGLGNQSELWMVDGCLWNPLINHSSHCQTVEQCSWQLWWSAKTDHNV